MSDKWSNIFDFTSAKLVNYSSLSFLSFFNLSDRDENGKPIYASPDKVLELCIQREKGYLYFIKEGKNKICEVWRKKMTKTELKGE